MLIHWNNLAHSWTEHGEPFSDFSLDLAIGDDDPDTRWIAGSTRRTVALSCAGGLSGWGIGSASAELVTYRVLDAASGAELESGRAALRRSTGMVARTRRRTTLLDCWIQRLTLRNQPTILELELANSTSSLGNAVSWEPGADLATGRLLDAAGQPVALSQTDYRRSGAWLSFADLSAAIVRIDDAGPGWVDCRTEVPHPFADGETVRLSGFYGPAAALDAHMAILRHGAGSLDVRLELIGTFATAPALVGDLPLAVAGVVHAARQTARVRGMGLDEGDVKLAAALPAGAGTTLAGLHLPVRCGLLRAFTARQFGAQAGPELGLSTRLKRFGRLDVDPLDGRASRLQGPVGRGWTETLILPTEDVEHLLAWLDRQGSRPFFLVPTRDLGHEHQWAMWARSIGEPAATWDLFEDGSYATVQLQFEQDLG